VAPQVGASLMEIMGKLGRLGWFTKFCCFQAPGESLGPLDSSFLQARHEPGAAGPVVEAVQVSML